MGHLSAVLAQLPGAAAARGVVVDVTSLLSSDEREALFEALSRDDLEAAWPLFDVGEQRAVGVAEAGGDGNENELRRYWLTGPGGRRIRWRTNGAFTRCVEEVSATGARSGLTNVKGYCANLYHAARGEWPGKAGRTGKKPAGPQKIDYVRRQSKGSGREKGGTVTKEAHIDGRRSYDDTRALVGNAVRARLAEQSGESYAYASVADLTDSQVVYSVYSRADPDALWQCSYAVDAAGTVTLGEPTRVVRTYAQSMTESAAATEAHTELGRVLEARGESDDGGRRYAVQVIRAGDSKNRRRYPLAVLEAAAPLYEGAQVYDGHRSDDQMRSSAIGGLVGYLTGVVATSSGLEAELSLLPSAGRVAEAFDAALELDGQRTDPFVGLSHDVMARFRGLTEGGQTVHEATEITAVNSVDVVAVPAAGGKATRVLAGGDPITITIDPAHGGGSTQEDNVPVTKADVLGVLKEATDDELSAVGLARAGTTTTEATVPESAAAPATTARESFVTRLMVDAKVKAADLPEKMTESVIGRLPAQVTEADVDREVQALADLRADLEPMPTGTVLTGAVTKEALDKKVAALDAMLAGDFREGYTSLRQAWADFTGARVMAWGEDVNRRILRESAGTGFDSATRARESLDSTSWNTVLGDSITRRMVAEYSLPQLDNWRRVVSSIVPLSDFRTNRRERVGGYGLLPTVNEGAPYQPLTSPGDEEVTYTIAKKGGTENLTIEMIANDDLGAFRRIPSKLGRAAAHTIHRFVWDLIITNPTLWDSVALFDAGHGNTSTTALSQSALSAARQAMRSQAAYGSSLDILSIVPRLLVVPNELEEIAFQLSRSPVAMPAGAPAGAASDIPNIHQGLDYLVLDHLTDATNWYLIADPALCPTIEVGFLNGRDTPELFTQMDPSVGSMFNNDSITYKIRYVFGGAPIEYRGLYGAIVAG